MGATVALWIRLCLPIAVTGSNPKHAILAFLNDKGLFVFNFSLLFFSNICHIFYIRIPAKNVKRFDQFLMGSPRPLFCLNTVFYKKTVSFSRIRTRIVRVEGEQADR